MVQPCRPVYVKNKNRKVLGSSRSYATDLFINFRLLVVRLIPQTNTPIEFRNGLQFYTHVHLSVSVNDLIGLQIILSL
jgi:hypothetical protein